MKYLRIAVSALSAAIVAVPTAVYAHCPLCAAGAGALAIFAASIGVSTMVVGVLIGAFALALGLWFAGLVRTHYIPLQRSLIALAVFLGTVVPIMPLIREYGPLYISFAGEYGTLLHNTYTVNLYVAGTIIGGAIMLAAPAVSRLITRMRGSQLPYQGVAVTLIALVLASVVIQWWPVA